MGDIKQQSDGVDRLMKFRWFVGVFWLTFSRRPVDAATRRAVTVDHIGLGYTKGGWGMMGCPEMVYRCVGRVWICNS